ncbi:tail fiber assembly protein [Atlantibacter hermannii]|uniref:tail fiber assembly protein n=1 Tax=Atlantibacter hermannii TaxID=565 RepID=UPI0028ABABEB|nr:tail fiber assembly protein [Atlantibacter hermannii]
MKNEIKDIEELESEGVIAHAHEVTYKFAKGLFYPSNIEYSSIPEDAIEVTESEFTKAMSRPAGWSFTVSDDGLVTLHEPPELTPEQIIAQAEAYKQRLLDDAQQKISVWQTKLLMGRKLTEAESARLNAWMDYIDAVTDIDTSKAPDINWPEKPQQQ